MSDTLGLAPLPSPAVADIAEKSRETMEWLRNNIAVGFTGDRGPAWWANGAVTKDGTWSTIPDGSHFEGPVPIEVVHKILDVKLVKGSVRISYVGEDGKIHTTMDERTQPIINARTGQVFGYPKDGYQIHPYLETLHGFMMQILDDSSVGVGSVGLLRKGGQAFIQVVLPRTFEVAGYGYQPYCMAVTSADQSRSTGFYTGALAGVCDNTVNSAIMGALTAFKIRHSTNSAGKVAVAREKLGIQLQQAGEEMGETIEALLNIEVTDEELTKWLDEAGYEQNEFNDKFKTGGQGYTSSKAIRDGFERMWREDDKVAPWRNTAFGVLQLDNTYRTWNKAVKNASRMERNYANLASGRQADEDVRALNALAKVKGFDLIPA